MGICSLEEILELETPTLVTLQSFQLSFILMFFSFENSRVAEKRRTGHLRPNIRYKNNFSGGETVKTIHGCDPPQVVFQVAFGRDPTRSAFSQPTNFGDGSGFCWKVRVLVSLGMHFIKIYIYI